ncbi:MAG: hypothetical protein GC145_18655 [Caulobacter sp.]|nr:hypothetical protein [Caulobacter sp.]
MAASTVMLSACETGPANPLDLTAARPDPVIETRMVTRTVCPDELNTAPAALPEPPADAEVIWNEPAKAWFDQLVDAAQAAIDQVLGAREVCREQGALQP